MVAGASFDWPGVFIGFFTGDWDDAGYATQQFAEEYVFYPEPDEEYPYVQYDRYYRGE